jgi:class 3 adenylate cyclase
VLFCGECGAALEGASPPLPAVVPPAPVAERRVVSVLFVDLFGFTAASEGRDAEETRKLLSRYFQLARTLVGRYGGTVEKFIGDGAKRLNPGTQTLIWAGVVRARQHSRGHTQALRDVGAAVADRRHRRRARQRPLPHAVGGADGGVRRRACGGGVLQVEPL